MFAYDTIEKIMSFFDFNIAKYKEMYPINCLDFYENARASIELMLNKYLGSFIILEYSNTQIILKDYKTNMIYTCKTDFKDSIQFQRQIEIPIGFQDTIVEFRLFFEGGGVDFLLYSLENGVLVQHTTQFQNTRGIASFCYDSVATKYYFERNPIKFLYGFYVASFFPDIIFKCFFPKFSTDIQLFKREILENYHNIEENIIQVIPNTFQNESCLFKDMMIWYLKTIENSKKFQNLENQMFQLKRTINIGGSED